MNEHTLSGEINFSGIGLHSGQLVNMSIKPAEAGHGILFIRTDLPEQPSVPADIKYVSNTQRSTTISSGEASVTTIEHLLSALMAIGVDNVNIELDGPEIPILDGTSAPYVEAFNAVGLKELDTPRVYLEIKEPITYLDEKTDGEITIYPEDHFQVTTLIDFDSDTLGPQFAELISMDDYATEIAPCRTFVFFRELKFLAENNLIKGGDLDNAIVIADQPVSEADLAATSKLLGKPPFSISKNRILNDKGLKFVNEPARHKLLDVIGDLALLGMPIKGRVVAKKPGHHINTEFVKKLKKYQVDQKKLAGKPDYDPDKPPIYDTIGVQKLLPHRYPFLLVDKIIELSEDRVVGVKSVTFNEPYFVGHFPGNPVMPGVLQIEAMAQTGGVLALSNVDDPENWDTYFIKINNAKFKQKVVPGDTLLITMDLLSPIRRGLVHMQGRIFVGNLLVSEGELIAKILRRPTE